MILGNKAIQEFIKNGDIQIQPNFNEKNIQPNSIDLYLDDLIIYENKEYKNFILPPNHFCLGSTIEKITLSKNVCGIVQGCSTEGRGGLQIECAGLIDSGFSGTITLEIKNLNHNKNINLEKGMRICQILFYQVLDCDTLYSGRYQNQSKTTKGKLLNDKK